MAFDWTAWKKFFSLFILLQLYLLTGMWVFHYLEREHEMETRVDTRKFKEQMLTNFTCLDQRSLEFLIDRVVYAIDNGVNPANNATNPSNWDFPGAFFYAGMIITTIGKAFLSKSWQTSIMSTVMPFSSTVINHNSRNTPIQTLYRLCQKKTGQWGKN